MTTKFDHEWYDEQDALTNINEHERITLVPTGDEDDKTDPCYAIPIDLVHMPSKSDLVAAKARIRAAILNVKTYPLTKSPSIISDLEVALEYLR